MGSGKELGSLSGHWQAKEADKAEMTDQGQSRRTESRSSEDEDKAEPRKASARTGPWCARLEHYLLGNPKVGVTWYKGW